MSMSETCFTEPASNAPPAYSRPELAVFHALLMAIGGRPNGTPDPDEAAFHLATSDTDEVTLHLQEEMGPLWLCVTMYPEGELSGLDEKANAGVIARWMRDTAAKLEAARAL